MALLYKGAELFLNHFSCFHMLCFKVIHFFLGLTVFLSFLKDNVFHTNDTQPHQKKVWMILYSRGVSAECLAITNIYRMVTSLYQVYGSSISVKGAYVVVVWWQLVTIQGILIVNNILFNSHWWLLTSSREKTIYSVSFILKGQIFRIWYCLEN